MTAVFYLMWMVAFSEWDYAEAYWGHCARMDAFYLLMGVDRR